MSTEVLNKFEHELLLKIARDNIKTQLSYEPYRAPNNLPDVFHDKLGVFVTLNINNNLRGCIGYPEPVKPLLDAVLDVSLSAAFEDPRFLPLTKEEFENITIEISVLTKPKEVIVQNFEEYLEKLTVGIDGLIIEHRFNRGLLLPQVPVEQNWDIQEFLENLCYKAGLNSDAWKSEDTKIYNFQAQVFQEK